MRGYACMTALYNDRLLLCYNTYIHIWLAHKEINRETNIWYILRHMLNIDKGVFTCIMEFRWYCSKFCCYSGFSKCWLRTLLWFRNILLVRQIQNCFHMKSLFILRFFYGIIFAAHLLLSFFLSFSHRYAIVSAFYRMQFHMYDTSTYTMYNFLVFCVQLAIMNWWRQDEM